MTINVLIFANCHGMIYKKALQEADINHQLTVDHIISYQNLNNFDGVVEAFTKCDVLIIQPVQSEAYHKFSLDYLKQYLKKDCSIIRIPFVRFEGFWDKSDVRELSKFKSDAVMFFPKINSRKEVPAYLNGDHINSKIAQSNFEQSLRDFSNLEKKGDVAFYDFFEKNYQKTPLFRDSYHLTKPFYDHICQQIVKAIKAEKNIDFASDQLIEMSVGKEYGHFKPIVTSVAQVLNLQYDLSSYFKFNRYDYLAKVLDYENSKSIEIIKDLNGLSRLFQS